MSGWKNMNSPLKLLLLMMFTIPMTAQAETELETVPTVELLEFLAEWETEDGDWIDPADLEDDDFAELLQLTDDE